MNLTILSQEEKDRVHELSLELLEEVGVEFPSELVLNTLKEAGVQVDMLKQRARFPRKMMEDALQSAPSSVLLGGSNPDKDLLLDGSRSYIGTDGQGVYTRDFETGKQRRSTLDDVIKATIISDTLDCVDIFWSLVAAGDLPPKIRRYRQMAEVRKLTGKHSPSAPHRLEEVPLYLEMLQVLVGGKEEITRRKTTSMICCPISPLKHDGEMTEAAMALTEYEIPIVPLPMPMAGGTSPASLLGTVIMNNVEVLSLLALLQVCRPGTPVIYGAAGSIMDMKRATFAAGAAEEGLINGACAEMARYYGLPSMTTGLVTDAVEPGIQASIEKVVNGIIPILAGSDGVIGIGLLQTDQCLSLEQLIIDAEMCGHLIRVKEGIKGGPEMAMTDLIKEVGPGGHFLAEESTCRLVRKGEHYIPGLFDRLPFEVWEQSGKPDMLSAARERVREILAKPVQCLLSEDQLREIDKIIEKAWNTL